MDFFILDGFVHLRRFLFKGGGSRGGVCCKEISDYASFSSSRCDSTDAVTTSTEEAMAYGDIGGVSTCVSFPDSSSLPNLCMSCNFVNN